MCYTAHRTVEGVDNYNEMESLNSWWNCNKTEIKKVLTPVATISSVIGGYLTVRYIYDQLSRKYHNYPPGPSGYPFIGSAIEYENDTRTFLNKLYKNDKKVSMFYVMFEPWIVIHDVSIVKKHFNKVEFGNRKEHPGMWSMNSILNTSYKDAHERRQVMIQSLISQAQRSKKLYQLIGKSIENDMFNKIDNCIKNKIKWDIRTEAQLVTFSTIYASTIGKSIDAKDELFQEFVKATQDLFSSWTSAETTASIIPHFMVGMKGLPGISPFREAQKKVMNIVQKWTCDKINNINQEIANGTIDVTNNSNGNNNRSKDDYVRELVILSQKKNIDINTILSDIAVSFFGGTHTTATSIEQGVLFLAQNPEIQEKVYNQLIEYKLDLKENRGNLKLLQKCSYLKAFVHETLRFNGVVTTGLPRSTQVIGKDGKCRKNQELKIRYFDEESEKEKFYHIPSNGVIVTNIWEFVTQPDQFGNGDKDSNAIKFDLDNWLTPDNKFNDSKYLAIFGHGSRSCAGQVLAKNELYLVLGLLLLNYKFKPPNNVKPEIFVVPFEFGFTPLGVQCEKR